MRTPAHLVLVALLAYAPLSAADDPGGVRSRIVLKTTTTATGEKVSYPRAGEPEVTAAVVEIPPGTATGWHRHRVPLYAWVVAGTLTVDYEDGTSATIKAGEALVEAVGIAHNGRCAGAETVKLLVFYTGVLGTPNAETVEKPAAAGHRPDGAAPGPE
jgi:quercetin dioxygenase-like cupin family protein